MGHGDKVAKRVFTQYGITITPQFVRAVLAVMQIDLDIKMELEQGLHDQIMEDIHGSHGQG